MEALLAQAHPSGEHARDRTLGKLGLLPPSASTHAMLPKQPKHARVLEVVTTFGSPTTWQVTSALSGLPGDAISLEFHDRVVAKLQHLQRDGWVTIEPVHLPSRTLLHLAGMEFRLTDFALRCYWDLPAAARRIVDDVGRRSGWVDERDLAAGCLRHISAPGNRRRALRRLVRSGVLDFRRHAEVGWFDVVFPTSRGWRHLRSGKLRRPDARHIRHAVLTIQAALQLLRDQPGARILAFRWDEFLRAEQRSGHDSSRRVGESYGQIPDAELLLQLGDGSEACVMIEILTSAYSDDSIRGKLRGLPEGTVFFVETQRLASRVQALTGKSPNVLSRMTYASPTLREPRAAKPTVTALFSASEGVPDSASL